MGWLAQPQAQPVAEALQGRLPCCPPHPLQEAARSLQGGRSSWWDELIHQVGTKAAEEQVYVPFCSHTFSTVAVKEWGTKLG